MDHGDATRPNAQVLLDVDYRAGAFELVLINVGSTLAYDIRVSFSRRLVGAGGAREISNLPLFERLTMLRPGKEIRVFLDAAPNVYRRRGSKRFTATVTWRDHVGSQLEAKYHHDLDAYRDLPEIVIED